MTRHFETHILMLAPHEKLKCRDKLTLRQVSWSSMHVCRSFYISNLYFVIWFPNWIRQILSNRRRRILLENVTQFLANPFSFLSRRFKVDSYTFDSYTTRDFDFSGSSIAISRSAERIAGDRTWKWFAGRSQWRFCFWRGPIVVRTGIRPRIMSSNFDEEIIAPATGAVFIRRAEYPPSIFCRWIVRAEYICRSRAVRRASIPHFFFLFPSFFPHEM